MARREHVQVGREERHRHGRDRQLARLGSEGRTGQADDVSSAEKRVVVDELLGVGRVLGLGTDLELKQWTRVSAEWKMNRHREGIHSLALGVEVVELELAGVSDVVNSTSDGLLQNQTKWSVSFRFRQSNTEVRLRN